jgi:hypothetical protein
MTRRRAFIVVLSLFFISILLRLPNLNRTVSKHHEFNTAVVLINIQSWREAGGGAKFNFVPLLNFQNAGDKLPLNAYYSIDSAGNLMYMSFGPAWYIIPYAMYELFHWPVLPVYLQCINLVFNLASVMLFFYMLMLLIPAATEKKNIIVVAACFLFMYSPGVLWYFGNGYINIGIMMPFVMAAILLLIPMLQSAKKISAEKLILLSLLIILLVYFDWFILAVCAVACFQLLFKIKKDKKYLLLLVVVAFSAIAAISLLFFQFASYAGWHAVSEYWSHRFYNRSIVNTDTSFWKMIGYVALNFITADLPLFLAMLVALLTAKSKKIRLSFSETEMLFLKIYTATVVLYNMALFEWSYEHEFSLIPWSILLSYLAGKIIITIFSKKQLYFLMPLFFIATISQYYFINRPGKISREGTPYISYKNFGEALKQVPSDYKIFLDIKQDPMIEYYAGRNINSLPGIEDAKKYMLRWHISKAVWVEHDGFEFQKIIIIDPSE